jgi:hypothetical protein
MPNPPRCSPYVQAVVKMQMSMVKTAEIKLASGVRQKNILP